MKQLNAIAYEGIEYTIEWYYDDRGYSQAEEYYADQSKDKQRKLLNLFRLIGEHGKIFDKTKFMNEGDGIYAFKPQPDRYLCFFFKGKKIVVTNAFVKKSQKLPQGEKELALKAHQSYEKRVKEGIYYERRKLSPLMKILLRTKSKKNYWIKNIRNCWSLNYFLQQWSKTTFL